jgi:hypothetical protein
MRHDGFIFRDGSNSTPRGTFYFTPGISETHSLRFFAMTYKIVHSLILSGVLALP